MPDAELEKAAQDAREIEAQKAAGRQTGVGILDELDRRVQNYGQLPGKGALGGSSKTAGFGSRTNDTPTSLSDASGGNQDGGEHADSESQVAAKKIAESEQKEETKRRAKSGRTVLSAISIMRPRLSRIEKLGADAKLG
jgi:hypothetical protein